MRFCISWWRALAVAALLGSCAGAHASERITLRNGFAVTCDHREPLDAEHVRLYLDATLDSYMDVPVANIATTEAVAPVVPPTSVVPAEVHGVVATASGSGPSIDSMIQDAGRARRLNVDLLRSVVQAESGGQVRATSRAGAQGLMQLMPATARSLGVTDRFAPDQNLRGGTDYLDSLLRRYHDDLSLALAAYNAGPAAVDRYHGVPPFRETQRYVARIIGEFNRRTLLARRSPGGSTHGVAVAPEVASAR